MIKTAKKVLIVLMVLFTGLNQQLVNVKAANSFTVNGVSVQYYDFTSAPKQCWQYANNMYTKIWGVSITSTLKTCNILEGFSAQDLRLTEEHLKEYIGYASLGSAIRLTNYEGLFSGGDFVGHSQVLVQKDENGFTILEGGMSCPGARREYYYTWAEYLRVWSKPQYQYIKYIVYPNAAKIKDIDKQIEQELITHIEDMKLQETRNEKIERTLNVDVVQKSNPEVAMAYENTVAGHIVALNRCTMSLLFVVSTIYFYIYKKNIIA